MRANPVFLISKDESAASGSQKPHAAAVNWLAPSRRRWRMKGGREQEEIGSIAQRPKQARRHYTSTASSKVPGYPPEIFDFVGGSGSYISDRGVTDSSPVWGNR